MPIKPTSKHYNPTTGELEDYPPGVDSRKAYYLKNRTEGWYITEIVRLRQLNKRQRTKIKQLQSQQNLP
jgi:hypothetical protein